MVNKTLRFLLLFFKFGYFTDDLKRANFSIEDDKNKQNKNFAQKRKFSNSHRIKFTKYYSK